MAEDGRLCAADPTTTDRRRAQLETARTHDHRTSIREPNSPTRAIEAWESAAGRFSALGRPMTAAGPKSVGYTVSGSGAAVPEQGEHQLNADRQSAEAEDEQDEATESRKRP